MNKCVSLALAVALSGGVVMAEDDDIATLEAKKAELERQIGELEAKQAREREIKELEAKLEALKNGSDSSANGANPQSLTIPTNSGQPVILNIYNNQTQNNNADATKSDAFSPKIATISDGFDTSLKSSLFIGLNAKFC